MPSLLISIFGPDGSGKSTQARILANYLQSEGLKVKIVWIKSFHTLAYVLSRMYKKLSPESITLNAYGHVIRINAVSRDRLSRLLWALIEFVSILPVVLLRAYMPLLMGRIIIAERYLIDSIVSIAYALNDPNFCSSFEAKALLSLIPVSSVLVHLDLDYDKMKERRGNLTDPEDFFSFQRKIYGKLSECLKAIKIDTEEQSINETATKIRRLALQGLNLVK